MKNWNMMAILTLLLGVMMFVIGISLSMEDLAGEPLEYWVLNSWRIEALLCGASFFLLALHYLNLGRIQDLYEEIEKLKEMIEGDMSE